MIGIASVVALTAIGTGSQKSVESQFTSFGSDTITVRSSGFFSSGNPLTLSDLAAINKTPGVKRTVYTVDTNATVTYNGTSETASISGTSPEIQGINHLQVEPAASSAPSPSSTTCRWPWSATPWPRI